MANFGSGKTLGLTYLAWKNWFSKKKAIYSNYHLYQIPYILIDTLEKLDKMKDGFFVADEFWLWVDSRCSKDKRNKVITDILLKSRKRGLTYCFTAQMLEQLDKRLRKVMDFSAYPIMNPNETICKIMIFRSGYPNPACYMKTMYFRTGLVFSLYNTNEEVAQISDKEDFSDPLIVFQESKDALPLFFEKWEDADRHAEEYWKKKYGASLKNLL